MEEFGGLGGLSAGILVVMVLKVVLDYIKSRDEANARAEKADGGEDCARNRRATQDAQRDSGQDCS